MVTLRETRSNRHRLTLERGSVEVRVWAPPLSVVFQTPAGRVADVGCAFDLSVEGAITRVRVTSGWVQLNNPSGEVLIPAGSSSQMMVDRHPGSPVYDDAVAGFREAVRQLEANPEGTGEAADRVAELARPRDVLTLLSLVQRRIARDRLVERAAELWPPPDPETVSRVLQGDRQALWRWHDTLELPRVKTGWWRNWRDGLPR
jgi:ferric-dicitrate binding protein FerR (iron transport regulator)